ncbi:uncharacterized protein LOC131953330 isoform X3 [Physella acuta]|uniref:uncharacterized protein LOC131953330 isoform X3 n=1 Tax=Physella acuta TaxID=109671 RepID=UPI0027DD676E|nr:uncharacterized protein LOC131953330 isoform X3 [Physella acuta]
MHINSLHFLKTCLIHRVKEKGLVVGNYNSLLDCFTEPTDPLLTGYIVRSIHYSIVKNRSLVCKQIVERQALFDIKNKVILKRFIVSVSHLMKKVLCLRRKQIINWHKLVELLNTPFSFNTSNEVKDTKKQNSLAIQSFFKCSVDPSSSADKQMTIIGESKYGLRIKPSCSKCPKINKELLQSKKTIKNLRQKLRCLPISLPRIQKLQEALLSTSRENEKLMSKLQEISDMHHNLLINVQLNNIEMEELKAENASLKAENKKLLEENTTMNEKLSTELILPFTFKMS